MSPAADTLEDDDQRERLATIVRLAHDKLAPFASHDVKIGGCPDRKSSKAIFGAGALEGIGFLLKMTTYGDKSGTISDAELARFLREGPGVVAEYSSGVANYSVVLSLLLTIHATIAVTHAAYQPFTAASSALRIQDAAYASVAGDTADFLWPENASGLRWFFYVSECVLVSWGTLLSLVGL